VESECGPYTLGLRRADRKKEYAIARTELYYRIATLRAVYFADEPDRRESFPYLAEAILRGHTAALDDLARIYEYETTDPRAARSEEAAEKRSLLSRLLGQERQFRRLKNKEGRDPTLFARAARMHHSWLSDYYVALCPEPQPFTHGMSPTAVLGDMPDYVTAAVTPLMRVNALCYLGECFFEGRGLPPDPQAAVVCYRAAVAVPFRPERGKPLPTSLVNANYSLGWCLLYGVGTPVDANAAVGFLNKVAKAHSGAAYTLGICHEEGRGVVIPDPREALKHYRRAQALGHPKAAERVLNLERLLKDREE
jgi:TPR repeat protein